MILNYISGNFHQLSKPIILQESKAITGETMADLMLENFSQPFTKYAHSKNTLSLNQAHGSPGNLLDLYAAFDIPETETFGSSYFPIPGLDGTAPMSAMLIRILT